MPTSRYRRFRRYSAFMRNPSRGIRIIGKSVIEDGKDVVSVLLRENASEDPRGRQFDIEMVDQITILLFTRLNFKSVFEQRLRSYV
ncbi:hypothetical protein EDB83DRAFT_308768 [Lactarius deliciosus]|nr:hypothetical protein EDB83DRAFT_308768 [Lactarius deliciosus]